MLQYRLRIASVIRDHGMHDRTQAPKDSRAGDLTGNRGANHRKSAMHWSRYPRWFWDRVRCWFRCKLGRQGR